MEPVFTALLNFGAVRPPGMQGLFEGRRFVDTQIGLLPQVIDFRLLPPVVAEKADESRLQGQDFLHEPVVKIVPVPHHRRIPQFGFFSVLNSETDGYRKSDTLLAGRSGILSLAEAREVAVVWELFGSADKKGRPWQGVRQMSRFPIYGVGLIALWAAAPPAVAADPAKFETHLMPAPVSDLTAESLTGEGQVTATLDGNKLAVSGNFEGLSASATEAHLYLGPGIGIPGASILELSIPKGTNGSVSGNFTLTRQQVTALKQGHLYVQINGQNSTTPYGVLWGWLLPEHGRVVQDVPDQGHWFMPQYDVPQGK